MLFLVFALFLMALTLAACSGLPAGETTTASPVDTTTAPTTVTTAVSDVTTAVTTTAAPAVRVEKNPITAAKIDESGNLVLKFKMSATSKRTTTVKYPTVTAGDGYNGAHFVSCELDEEDRTVTLTLLDNLARNQANIALGIESPEAITVYLRENDGKLEYATAKDGAYTVLAAYNKEKNEDGVPLMSAMVHALGYARQEEHTAKEGTILAIREPLAGQEKNGAFLRFRATEWSRTGQDLCMDTYLNGSSNGFFNISGLFEIPSDAEKNSFTGGTAFKYSGDDITPININGTYIGANHGYNLIQCLPKDPSYGLTEADIGRVFSFGEGGSKKQYVLVRIDAYTKELRQNMIWFCPFDETAMQTGNFSKFCSSAYKIPAGTELVSDDGLPSITTNSETCPGYSAGVVQFYTALNHVKQHAFLDGKYEVDIQKAATYDAEFIDFYEEYDVVYLPAALQYLIDNVGSNNERSHCSDVLQESYVTFRICYRFHKNGATVVYSDYDFHKDVSLHIIGGVQSGAFSETDHYIYLPGSSGAYATPALQPYASVHFGMMENGQPQSSCFQLTDTIGSKAINLGFNTVYGDGTPEKRTTYLKNGCVYYYTSYKMYPYFISGGTLKAGDHFSFIGYRLPSVIYDEDFFAVNWYWVGDEIFLSLHTDKAVDKTVALPDYMSGMTAEVIEGSGLTVGDSVTNAGLTATSAGAGYAIIRLTPAK